ncbi:hypothetical protein YSA_06631 [Pseudomonas putida ND6]|uniref:Uncharacterized protein n=1 Tax=Pseudomonas putida ND6 TaxID=231023 RepID=I3UXX4_PSEPU|nr:hypothetical protein YSA_06631 [Pseudomonas putida ND6]
MDYAKLREMTGFSFACFTESFLASMAFIVLIRSLRILSCNLEVQLFSCYRG